jgi:PTH1 family peptidyl-tRNA hydrolase
VKAVFGLGNPGAKYAFTRHNVGFQTVDLYRKAHRLRRAGRIVSNCLVYRDGDLLLCKPLTFMNASGHAVARVLSKHRISVDDALIVYDELDLPLGRTKISPGGGPGTHKGMRSIQEALGTQDVPRLRIGVEIEGRTAPGEDFVLERFPIEEWACVLPALERAAEAIDAFRTESLQDVMSRFNGRGDSGCRA